jgi:hypothetical protein
MVKFHCNAGHMMEGQPISTCTERELEAGKRVGQWSSEVPRSQCYETCYGHNFSFRCSTPGPNVIKKITSANLRILILSKSV